MRINQVFFARSFQAATITVFIELFGEDHSGVLCAPFRAAHPPRIKSIWFDVAHVHWSAPPAPAYA